MSEIPETNPNLQQRFQAQGCEGLQHIGRVRPPVVEEWSSAARRLVSGGIETRHMTRIDLPDVLNSMAPEFGLQESATLAARGLIGSAMGKTIHAGELFAKDAVPLIGEELARQGFLTATAARLALWASGVQAGVLAAASGTSLDSMQDAAQQFVEGSNRYPNQGWTQKCTSLLQPVELPVPDEQDEWRIPHLKWATANLFDKTTLEAAAEGATPTRQDAIIEGLCERLLAHPQLFPYKLGKAHVQVARLQQLCLGQTIDTIAPGVGKHFTTALKRLLGYLRQSISATDMQLIQRFTTMEGEPGPLVLGLPETNTTVMESLGTLFLPPAFILPSRRSSATQPRKASGSSLPQHDTQQAALASGRSQHDTLKLSLPEKNSLVPVLVEMLLLLNIPPKDQKAFLRHARPNHTQDPDKLDETAMALTEIATKVQHHPVPYPYQLTNLHRKVARHFFGLGGSEPHPLDDLPNVEELRNPLAGSELNAAAYLTQFCQAWIAAFKSSRRPKK